MLKCKRNDDLFGSRRYFWQKFVVGPVQSFLSISVCSAMIVWAAPLFASPLETPQNTYDFLIEVMDQRREFLQALDRNADEPSRNISDLVCPSLSRESLELIESDEEIREKLDFEIPKRASLVSPAGTILIIIERSAGMFSNEILIVRFYPDSDCSATFIHRSIFS